MTILYLCFDPGIELFGSAGSSIHIRSMVNAFAARGHDVVVVATSLGPRRGDIQAKVIGAPIGKLNRTAARLMQRCNKLFGRNGREHPDLVRMAHNLSFRCAVSRAVREYRPDFIYERYSLWGIAGLWASRIGRIPLVVEVNAPLAYEQQKFRGLTFPATARRVESVIWRRADQIMVVSSALVSPVTRAGQQPERIHTLPNAVEPIFFQRADAVQAKRRHSLEQKFVIGFAGSFKQWHGVDFLIRAFARFQREYAEAHLLLVGDGPERLALERVSSELGIARHVKFAGQIAHQHMPLCLAAMDVAAAPYPLLSNFYFSPLKVYEYMASGRAVVATRAGQIGEVIDHGRNGLLFEAGNQEDFLRCLRMCIEDSEFRQGLARNAAASVRDSTWLRNADLVARWAALDRRRASIKREREHVA